MHEWNLALVTGGLAVGVAFAYSIQRFRLCLVGGTSSLLLIRDFRQVNAFVTTWLVAIIGTQFLELTHTVAIAESSYRNNQLDWLGAATGGILFGVGATLSGGCAARTVIRAMEGSVSSFIVLVSFALAAGMTQYGLLESPRIKLSQATSIMLSTDSGLASILTVPPWIIVVTVVVALGLILYTGWRRSPDRSLMFAGTLNGILVLLGWVITGNLAQSEFDVVPPSSITLSGPLARFGYMVSSGRVPELTFSVMFSIGLALGALSIALLRRQFNISYPSRGTIKVAVLGGVLMGVGATLGYGCNIGQGMTGISTLSLESIIAVAGIVTGIAITTKWMELRSG